MLAVVYLSLAIVLIIGAVAWLNVPTKALDAANLYGLASRKVYHPSSVRLVFTFTVMATASAIVFSIWGIGAMITVIING